MNTVVSIFERLGMVEKVNDKDIELTQPELSELKKVVEKQSINDKQEEEATINKLLSVQEIYKKAGFTSEPTSTVFIIDSFSKALPESLPTTVKRQSVINLISTSGMDIQNILKDGKKRLVELSSYLQHFSGKTDDSISKSENEIKRLLQKINDHKKQINDLKKLKQEQKAVIEYETQKIQNIIQFIDTAQ